MHTRTSNAASPCLYTLVLALATIPLFLHLWALVHFPGQSSDPFAYIALGLATLGSASVAALLAWRTRPPVRYRWALVAVAFLCRALNYFNAADSQLLHLTPRAWGFLFLSVASACLLIALTAVYVAGSRLLRVLDVVLALFLCVLRYVAQWGGGRGIFVSDSLNVYNFFSVSYLFLAAAAFIAALAAISAEELRFARLLLLYLVLQALAGVSSNQVAHFWLSNGQPSPWMLTGTCAELLFTFFALRSLTRPLAEPLYRSPSLVARGTMPVFLALATIGLGVLLLPSYHRLGLAGIVVGIVGYAARTVYTQLYYIHTQNDLLSRNTHLEDLLDRDTLTGIGNRRSLATAIDRHCAEAHPLGQSVYLLLIDIDSFKQANDALGHLYGDRCLLSIANALARELRPTQHHLARYGGDEFAVVLRSPDRQHALQTADYLRLAVTDLQLGAPGQPLSLSIGVAQATLPSAAIGHLLETADRALYAAKNQGRNCVVFGPEPVHPTSADLVRT